MAATQLKKVSWWHESILDWELEFPEKSMRECAAHFGVSETWLSIIRNSDIYREYAASRRKEHNSAVSKTVIDRVEEVAEVSLEVLQERISKERATIGLGVVNDTCALALKALGFGQRRDDRGGAQVNVFLGAANPEVLDRARQKMRLVNAHKVPDSEPQEEEGELAPKSLPAPT